MNTVKLNKRNLKRWRERGQGLVEYAMIIAMIVIVVIVMLTYLGNIIFFNYYSKIGSSMNNIVH